METTVNTPKPNTAPPRGWPVALLNLLPLWLIVLAVSAEGFPPPPIRGAAAMPMMLAALALVVVLAVMRWMQIEMFLYSIVPIYFAMTLDEITNQYKFFFILALGVLMSLGVLVSFRFQTRRSRVEALAAAAVVCILLTANASQSYWRLQEHYNVVMCFFDYPNCPPLPADAPAWWRVFIGIW